MVVLADLREGFGIAVHEDSEVTKLLIPARDALDATVAAELRDEVDGFLSVNAYEIGVLVDEIQVSARIVMARALRGWR